MNQLVIELIGRAADIEAGPFVHVLHATINLLRDLEANLALGPTSTARWNIEQITKNSPLKLTIGADNFDTSPKLMPIFFSGLRSLENNHEVAPEYFHEDQLNKVKSIVSVLTDKSGHGIAQIKYSSPHEGVGDVAVIPTLRTMSHIDMLIGPHYERWASFEGTLEVVNFHGRKREFNIYDVITNRKIICTISPELQEKIPAALLKRVQVYGMSKFNRQNKPLSIRVERFKVYKSRVELPQLRDLAGIDITGGQDATAYVRSLRDV